MKIQNVPGDLRALADEVEDLLDANEFAMNEMANHITELEDEVIDKDSEIADLKEANTA